MGTPFGSPRAERAEGYNAAKSSIAENGEYVNEVLKARVSPERGGSSSASEPGLVDELRPSSSVSV